MGDAMNLRNLLNELKLLRHPDDHGNCEVWIDDNHKLGTIELVPTEDGFRVVLWSEEQP